MGYVSFREGNEKSFVDLQWGSDGYPLEHVFFGAWKKYPNPCCLWNMLRNRAKLTMETIPCFLNRFFVQIQAGFQSQMPYAPCREYLPKFPLVRVAIFHRNHVGKYSIHRSYGIGSFQIFPLFEWVCG